MRYEEGRQIAPGCVISEQGNNDEAVYPYQVSTPGGSQWITLELTDYLASLGEQIESLKKQVPTEWRTGEPNWLEVGNADMIQFCHHDGNDIGIVGFSYAKHQMHPSAWTSRQHRIIPYVAPHAPTQPKTLTVDDLPTFDGRVQWDKTCQHQAFKSLYQVVPIVDGLRITNLILWEDSIEESVEAALAAVNAGKLDQFLKGGAK